jgi:hypothetical protein
MSKDDEYRKYAREAQERAERTTSPLDKASWLRVAQGWLSLIRKPRPSAEQSFDDSVQARGTGQDTSKDSH